MYKKIISTGAGQLFYRKFSNQDTDMLIRHFIKEPQARIAARYDGVKDLQSFRYDLKTETLRLMLFSNQQQDEGSLLGWGELYPRNGSLELKLYVLQKHSGKNLGFQLGKLLIKQGKKQQAQKIYAIVEPQNLPSLKTNDHLLMSFNGRKELQEIALGQNGAYGVYQYWKYTYQ